MLYLQVQPLGEKTGMISDLEAKEIMMYMRQEIVEDDVVMSTVVLLFLGVLISITVFLWRIVLFVLDVWGSKINHTASLIRNIPKKSGMKK